MYPYPIILFHSVKRILRPPRVFVVFTAPSDGGTDCSSMRILEYSAVRP